MLLYMTYILRQILQWQKKKGEDRNERNSKKDSGIAAGDALSGQYAAYDLSDRRCGQYYMAGRK